MSKHHAASPALVHLIIHEYEGVAIAGVFIHNYLSLFIITDHLQ